MTRVALLPARSSSSLATVVGADSFHEALADDSDTSYVYFTDEFGAAELEFDEIRLPASAVVTNVSVNVRNKSSDPAWVVIILRMGPTPLPPNIALTETFVTWPTPTTFSAISVARRPDGGDITQADLNAIRVNMSGWGNSGLVTTYELAVQVVYVTPPRVTDVGPNGLIEDTNAPTVTWRNVLDPDGGPQSHWAVRVYSEAQYTAPGFEVGVTPPVASKVLQPGSRSSWTVDVPLDNGKYRAYVRISQQTGAHTLTSDDSGYAEFTINVSPPDPPVIRTGADGSNGRVQITVDGTGSTEDVDYMRLERSTDGGETWEPAVTPEVGGYIPGEGPFVTYDWLAGNGQEVLYRAHSYRYIPPFNTAIGSRTATETGSWQSQDRWLKHPTDSTLNMKVDIWAYPDDTQEARQSTFMPLGGTVPITVSDTPNATTGEISFMVGDSDERAAFAALRNAGVPLLLQMRPGDGRPDRWITLGARRRAYAVDKLGVQETIETYAWTEVGRP